MSAKRTEAAMHIAAGALTLDAICAEIGVAKSTLRGWLTRREFAAATDEYRQQLIETLEANILNSGVALRRNRIERLTSTHAKIVDAIRLRGERFQREEPETPELHSGLFKVTEYSVGKTVGTATVIDDEFEPRDVETVTLELRKKFEFDAPIHQALLDIEAQAARELNQWTPEAFKAPPGKAIINVDLDLI